MAGDRGARAGRGALLGLAAGAVLGLLDALRSRLEPGSVLPASLSPLVVLLYAAAWAPAGALLGALLPPAAAAALALAGAGALGLGLAANHWWLPAFTDPISLAGDGGVLLLAAGAAWILRRRFAARGVPGPRAAAAAALAALAISPLLALGAGRDDGPPPAAARAGAGDAPDILLVLVDTLRADAPGFSGAPGAAATPAMDALAAEGTVFTRCRAPSSWTKPATASLLTGLYPSEHGALGFQSVIPGEAATLAEILRAAGWRTGAWADNPFVSPEYGFAQGFDRFQGRRPSALGRGTLLLRAAGQVRLRIRGGTAYSFEPEEDLGADRILDGAVSFLLEGAGRPSFAYAHLIEPHFPYAPPPPFDGGRPRVDPPHASGILPFDSFPDLPPAAKADMRANYLGEVSAADAALGRALRRLREAGRLERTLVILTGDHGEEFHEHGGWTHGQSLYEELVRVPLVVRAPGGAGAGRRAEAPVSLVDVAPTILDLAGVAAAARFSGRSLRPALRGEALPAAPLYAEIDAGPAGARALFLGPEALVLSWKSGRAAAELFDLREDPGERRNLLAAPGGAAEAESRLRALLESGFGAMERGGLRRAERSFDEETRRALEAIGYTGK